MEHHSFIHSLFTFTFTFHFHFHFITINFCRVVPRTSLSTSTGVGGRQRGSKKVLKEMQHVQDQRGGFGTKKFPGKSLAKNSKLTFNFTRKSLVFFFPSFLIEKFLYNFFDFQKSGEFYKRNPFKIFSEKKSTLKFGLKNTLQDRQVGDHF